MKVDNLFDRALQVRSIPDPYRDAAVVVTDTLDLAWDAARSVFEDEASPDHAIQICRMFLEVAGKLPCGTGLAEEQ